MLLVDVQVEPVFPSVLIVKIMLANMMRSTAIGPDIQRIYADTGGSVDRLMREKTSNLIRHILLE